MHSVRRRAVALLPAAAAFASATACGGGPSPLAPHTVTLAVAPATPAAPGTVGSADLASTRSAPLPVKGHFSGAVTSVGPETADDPGVPSAARRITFAAEGITSHLGRASVVWSVPAMQLDLSESLRPVLRVFTMEWDARLVAANGDQVFAKYTFRENTIPLTNLVNFEAVTDLKVVGGTGRFRGSTGEGVAIIKGSVATLRFTIDLDGWGTLGGPK